jgi:MFS family permease
VSLLSVESSLSLPEDEENEAPVSMSDVASFPLALWVIFLITVAFYASVFVFIQNGSQFLEQTYAMKSQPAAFLMSLPYTVSALACPVFGYLVDRTGRAGAAPHPSLDPGPTPC